MEDMSELGADIELEKVMCQISVWLDDVRVGFQQSANFTTEQKKKLGELGTKISKDFPYPFLKQLLKWFSHPLRISNDFISVAGLLLQNCEEDFGCRICLPYFIQVMIEALAIQDPTLENSWEHAALLVVNLIDQYGYDENTISPDFLSDWIIRVIGDPNICLELRIKLISSFKKMAFVNDHNWEIALQSVMFSCSSLNIEDENDCFLMLSPSVITKIFEVFSKYEKMFDFDYRLFEKLQNARTSQQSAILYDVSYTIRMNSSRCIAPMEVKGLIALLNTISRYSQLEYKTLQEKQILLIKVDQIKNLEEISGTLQILISSFTKSCQMPQLIGETASCFMDVMELVLQVYVSLFADQGIMHYSLYNCERSLLKLYVSGGHLFTYLPDKQDIITSSIGREIISKFNKRLRGIRSKLEPLEPLDNYFPTIHSLVFFD